MSGDGDESKANASPCVPLARAARVLLPARRTGRGRPDEAEVLPLTIARLKEVLADLDEVRFGEWPLPEEITSASHFPSAGDSQVNMDLWGHVAELRSVLEKDSSKVTWGVLSEYLDFVLDAIRETAYALGCGPLAAQVEDSRLPRPRTISSKIDMRNSLNGRKDK